MSDPSPSQLEIEFGASAQEHGFQAWLNQRRAALTALARQLGLPIGHPAEIWLKGDVRLSGVLELAEPPLFISDSQNAQFELRVERCTFSPTDIESCVRVDDWTTPA